MPIDDYKEMMISRSEEYYMEHLEESKRLRSLPDDKLINECMELYKNDEIELDTIHKNIIEYYDEHKYLSVNQRGVIIGLMCSY